MPAELLITQKFYELIASPMLTWHKGPCSCCLVWKRYTKVGRSYKGSRSRQPSALKTRYFDVKAPYSSYWLTEGASLFSSGICLTAAEMTALPCAAGEEGMVSLSWRGRALSLGTSSGTMARGWPSTTAASRHTCLIRGPPTRCLPGSKREDSHCYKW